MIKLYLTWESNRYGPWSLINSNIAITRKDGVVDVKFIMIFVYQQDDDCVIYLNLHLHFNYTSGTRFNLFYFWKTQKTMYIDISNDPI